MDQAEKLRNIIKKNQISSSESKVQTARVITVSSGKGGVGKSNVAINLAVQFKKMGKKVLILDADFGLANIEVMFGAIPKYSLADVIYKGMGIRDVITNGPMDIGFISGGSGVVGMNNLGSDTLNFLVKNIAKLDEMADVVIIDTGAGISEAVLEFLLASEEIILVTTPEPTSITDSYSLLKALKSNSRFRNETKLRVIANKVASTEDGQQLYHKLATVVEQYLGLETSLLGVIPQDVALKNAVMQQSPVTIASPSAQSARAFQDIADTLMNVPHTDKVYKKGMAAFFARFTGT
ncbi:MAG: MinD/ParA family protein [Lachnospiraceae bacterium]|nr:MinD/ParA family protein [Lachnospiraceae bacterium]MCR5776973.1 MinD/ParA family protein [Lachnospiraceae bacterium]